jgi:hypothetical protein
MTTTTSGATTKRVDVYTRVTDQIVADLERGVRPWLKPWNAEHAAGRITRPLRHSGEPYQGINILMLWASAEMAGFNLPVLAHIPASQTAGRVCAEGRAWLAGGLRQHVQEDRDGRRWPGDRIGDSVPEGNTPSSMRARWKICRSISTSWPSRRWKLSSGSSRRSGSLPTPRRRSARAGIRRITPWPPTTCRCRPSSVFEMPSRTRRRSPMS